MSGQTGVSITESSIVVLGKDFFLIASTKVMHLESMYDVGVTR